MFKTLIASLLDVDGQTSSKRIVLYFLTATLITMAIFDTLGKAHFHESTWDDIFYGVMLFGGYVVAEKFTKRSIRNEDSNSDGSTNATAQ